MKQGGQTQKALSMAQVAQVALAFTASPSFLPPSHRHKDNLWRLVMTQSRNPLVTLWVDSIRHALECDVFPIVFFHVRSYKSLVRMTFSPDCFLFFSSALLEQNMQMLGVWNMQGSRDVRKGCFKRTCRGRLTAAARAVHRVSSHLKLTRRADDSSSEAHTASLAEKFTYLLSQARTKPYHTKPWSNSHSHNPTIQQSILARNSSGIFFKMQMCTAVRCSESCREKGKYKESAANISIPWTPCEIKAKTTENTLC